MSEEFKVIVAGDKRIYNFALVKEKLDKILSKKLKTDSIRFITSGQSGAEKCAEWYAGGEGNIKVDTVKVDWDGKGKRAGYFRNDAVTDIANALIVFSISDEPIDKGTEMLLSMAKKKQLLVRHVKISREECRSNRKSFVNSGKKSFQESRRKYRSY